jgi:hypothetical protein
VFETDLREDDAQSIIAAIKQLRGVSEVSPVITTTADHFARRRIKQTFLKDVYAFLDKLGEE